MSDRQHHLVAYALGTLNSDKRAEVESQLSADESMRIEFEQILATLEQLSGTQSKIEPERNLRERIVGAAGKKEPFAGFVKRLEQLLDLKEKEVTDALSLMELSSTDHWETSDIHGTQLIHFDGGPRVQQADCGFVKIESGHGFPAHEHQGDEWAMVLQGEALEQDGKSLLPGDISYREAGSQHAFTSVGKEPLILVVVVHTGIRFLSS